MFSCCPSVCAFLRKPYLLPSTFRFIIGLKSKTTFVCSPSFTDLYGATENARHENTGRSKMQGWKMRDMNMRDQIAGVETAGKVSMESQSVKKCLKVVAFVCRGIPSV